MYSARYKNNAIWNKRFSHKTYRYHLGLHKFSPLHFVSFFVLRTFQDPIKYRNISLPLTVCTLVNIFHFLSFIQGFHTWCNNIYIFSCFTNNELYDKINKYIYSEICHFYKIHILINSMPESFKVLHFCSR